VYVWVCVCVYVYVCLCMCVCVYVCLLIKVSAYNNICATMFTEALFTEAKLQIQPRCQSVGGAADIHNGVSLSRNKE